MRSPAAIVLLAGMAWLGGLQSATPYGVFFAGDAGVKLLVTQRVLEGRIDGTLDPPAPPWVRKQWEGGLFPLEPPFAYPRGLHFQAGFPATAPLLAAPFYRLWGFRGLHVPPALGAVAIWFSFLVGARALRLPRPLQTSALALLVFGTPVTLYGAMVWEHTVAVAFAFGGLVLLVERGTIPLSRLAAGGALLGTAAWFREELLALALPLAGLSLLPPRVHRSFGMPRRTAWAIAAGVASSLALYLVFNFTIHGTAMGVRGLQLDSGSLVVEGSFWEEKPRLAWAIARSLYTRLAASFPPACLVVALGSMAAVACRRRLAGGTRLLMTAALAVLVFTPLLPLNDGGKQLGPRYLLVVFPLMTLLGAELLRRSGQRLPKAAFVFLAVVASALATWSVFVNSWMGPHELQAGYRKRALAVSVMEHDSHQVVAVSDQFVAQQLAVLWPRKFFFLARHGKELKTLVAAAGQEGIDEIAFLCNPARPCPPFESTPDERVLRLDDERSIEAVRVDDAGQYVVYHLRIVPAAAPGV